MKHTDFNKITTEEFIQRARKVHGNKYDYSKSEYVNSKTKNFFLKNILSIEKDVVYLRSEIEQTI